MQISADLPNIELRTHKMIEASDAVFGSEISWMQSYEDVEPLPKLKFSDN